MHWKSQILQENGHKAHNISEELWLDRFKPSNFEMSDFQLLWTQLFPARETIKI